MKTKTTKSVDIHQTSNGAKSLIAFSEPYVASVTVQGVTPLLFHAWNIEDIEEKARAVKNSAAKKTDNLESYVYRDSNGLLGIAGPCIHGSLIEAARYLQDPRSPRKAARDLVKAAVQVLTPVAVFQPERKEWDYEDRRRVVIQRAAITRTRPAMKEGWKVSFELLVTVPEYINEIFLQEILKRAGGLCGVCDFRPTYGRFNVISFSRIHTSEVA